MNDVIVNDKIKILRSRAAELAREPEDKSSGQNRIEIVEFQLASERYALQSSFIGEVYPMKELTSIPCTPEYVLGVINVRGRILSVIDLRRFFDLPVKGITDLNKVIVLRKEGMEFGILADAVIEDRWINRADVLPSLPTLIAVRAEYLLGVTRERLIVLDGEKILSDRGIIVHEDV